MQLYHSTQADSQSIIYKKYAMRLILAPNMTAIYYNAALHSASKSREYFAIKNSLLTREDMQLFMYAWKFDKSNSQNCTGGFFEGVVREYREKIFSETIHQYTCPQLYTEDPTCTECCKPGNIMDLRDISIMSGQTREK